jgi:hypothetical protein
MNTKEVKAKRTVTYPAALEVAKEAARFAAQLRTGIAEGNLVVLDIPEGLLDASYLV